MASTILMDLYIFSLYITNSMHPWRNWIAHLTSDQRVGGSNPSGCAIPCLTGLLFSTFSVPGSEVKCALQRCVISSAGCLFLMYSATKRRWHISGVGSLHRRHPCSSNSGVRMFSIFRSLISGKKLATYSSQSL